MILKVSMLIEKRTYVNIKRLVLEMKEIKKLLSCTLIAMLLFSCENNKNDDSTEAV